MQGTVEKASISQPKSFKALLEVLLKPDERVAAWALGISAMFSFSGQQIFGHCRNYCSGEEIRGQHGEDYRLGKRHKEVACDPGQQEHRGKDNADRKSRDEGRRCDLRRAFENNLVHVLLWFCLSISIDVLD